MNDKPTWPLKDHTRAKHELLRHYLNAWFPILASSGFNQRIIFLDGFAGPGVYSKGELGSPLVAIDTLIKHSYFEQMSRSEFVFIFVEEDHSSFELLKQTIDQYWEQEVGGKPNNVHIHPHNDEFANVASDLAIISRSNQLAPTMAFIDPFGWTGAPLKLIGELLASDKCEVLFNFSIESVNRFIGDKRPGIAQSFTSLFGTTENEHRKASGLKGEERESFLLELYKRQLRKVGKFKFVESFEMVDKDRRRTPYFLIFGTRHPRGLQAMKDAMWEIDPVSGEQFRGFANNQLTLFSEEPNITQLRNVILERFSGKLVAAETVKEYVLVETRYKISHCTEVLKDLENEDIFISISGRKKRGGYPKGTKLQFP